MLVKILFFARAKELAGKNGDSIQIGATIKVSDLKKLLVEKYNLQIIQNNFVLSLNEEYCDQEDTLSLKEGDEIAVIPPLSGG